LWRATYTESAIGSLDARLTAVATQQLITERIRHMRSILKSTALLTLFAAFAFAESWTGTLLDASCYSQQKSASSCRATGSTTSFALNVSGQVFIMDDAGNTQASAALKNRADRTSDADANAKDASITAKVTGTKDGNQLKVDNVEVQ
jgi:hypothetical protein